MGEKYRLQAVLEQKQSRKLLALKELANAIEVLQKYQDLLDKLAEEKQMLESIIGIKSDALFTAISDANIPAYKVVDAIRFIEKLKQKIAEKNIEIASQNRKIMEKEYDVDRKRQDVVRALAELEKIKLHHRKWVLNGKRLLIQKEMTMLQDIYISYPQKGFLNHDQTY